MVHYDTCPLCDSGGLTNAMACTDHFVTREAFTIVKCSRCGFLFTQDHPGENEAGRYYESEEYISHSDTSEGLMNKLYRFARTMMLRKKTALVKNETGLSHGTILDIGSGTGYFADAMTKTGWRAEGIEINPKAREFSKTSFGLNVFDPSETWSIEKGKYDCITLWHVLEHFNDPNGYMQQIRRLLKPGGRCIIALPNSSSYDAIHYKEYWAAWDVPRHIWHFTPQTFRRFAEKAGFELLKIKTLPLDVFYISMLSEKYRGSKFNFIKGIFTGKLMWMKSQFNKEKTSSLIYILRGKE